MKLFKPIKIFSALLLSLALLCAPLVPVRAASNLTVTASVSPVELVTPSLVTITVRFSLPAGSTAAQNVRIVDAEGIVQYTHPEAIEADAANVTASYSYAVEEAQIGQSIPFTMMWDAEGTTHTKAFTVQVRRLEGDKAVLFSRTVDKTQIEQGGEVRLTYTVQNVSSSTLSGLQIIETLTSSIIPGLPATLAPGERAEVTHTYKPSVSGYSTPTLYYTFPGNINFTKTLDPVEIRLVTSSVTLRVQADKTQVEPGGDVVLSAVIDNSGGGDLTDLIVTDELGERLYSLLELAAGQVHEFEMKIKLDAPRLLVCTLKYTDADRQVKEVQSGQIDLTVVGVASFTVSLSALPDRLVGSGTITVQALVKNTGEKALNNFELVTSQRTMLTHPRLEPGQSVTLEYEQQLGQTTTLQVTATAKDDDGQVVSAQSDPMQIEVAPIVATPTPSSDGEEQPEPILGIIDILYKMGIAVLLLLAACALLFGVMLFIQRYRKKAKAKAPVAAVPPPDDEDTTLTKKIGAPDAAAPPPALEAPAVQVDEEQDKTVLFRPIKGSAAGRARQAGVPRRFKIARRKLARVRRLRDGHVRRRQ